ncbi:MAG: TRAP transporter small permease [Rhodospirillaceae bacterium]|jgi:TRAP-type C4-dicarboxylate transport system permease small subunit|nr:TRAP transporter small permease [Rhodospirillaceae bacterium]MBT3883214.1 TRAP transporter small permease [Rhodospirillaceae bacterium]MBT4116417.1 TRAP transporter small permease [Rhodospirillaceae bacterium]MBT4670529.1 TRAP transporter small permease [Rhodospirillaceae bacterium]MBT4722040.1 TRAP transporter small permease [Rhodospirillaceae bacterium]
MANGEAAEPDNRERESESGPDHVAKRIPEPPPHPALKYIFVTLPRLTVGTALLAGIAVNFVNVITRHFFGFALFWAEEILVFGVLWSTAIAVIAITFNGDHLRMDLFSARLKSPWREIVNAATVLVFLSVCTFVAVQSYAVVSAFAETGMVSTTVALPLTVPHSALLVGLSLMVLAVIVRTRSYIRGRF